MAQIRGYCHRVCNECEIFKVTQADDDQKRATMAVDCSELLDQPFKPEDINCDGWRWTPKVGPPEGRVKL